MLLGSIGLAASAPKKVRHAFHFTHDLAPCLLQLIRTIRQIVDVGLIGSRTEN
jgi:hypothetical protein